MHRRPLVLLVLIVALPAHAQVYHVYVAAESDDTVSLVRFDGQKATVEKTLAVGTLPTEVEGPHGLTVSPDGRHWYVSLSHGQPYGKVVKFATGTDERLGEVELDLFPASMHVSRATGLLYVVNFNLHGATEPSTVSVVDPVAMTEVARTVTGVMPHGSRLGPDGLRHYSVTMMSGELVEIDALTFTVRRRLRTGDGDPKPSWVVPHPAAPFVYVANNGSDEVVEIDLDTWTVSRRDIEREVKNILLPRVLGLLPRVLGRALWDDRLTVHVNPTGRFVLGGPAADAGLTGRKIIVDSYGARGAHGGRFSGKDPSKVDRSAAYAARHVAKNLVAARLAESVEVQIAYAIGVAEPVSIHVDSSGTGALSDERLTALVRDTFDLRPAAIIKRLDLLRPVYLKTAAYGHFGRSGFSWEDLDDIDRLRSWIRPRSAVFA